MDRPLLLRSLGLVPATVHAAVLARLFNCVMASPSATSRLAALEGKRLDLRIIDADLVLRFAIKSGRICSDTQGMADAVVCGRLSDFLRLILNTDDPDTLFFSRRLTVEGDIEFALHARNILDAVEYDWKGCLGRTIGPPAAASAIAILQRSRINLLLRRLLLSLPDRN